MTYSDLATQPLVLNRNRVKRIYQGGAMLDRWQGIEPGSDGSYPEEYLVSTIEVSTLTRAPGEGLSTVDLEGGQAVPLRDIIASDPEAFLGAEQSAACNQGVGVLARAGDPVMRMIIQVHPDAECSRKYLNALSGKTESWVFISCREMQDESPHAYAGFKPGITRRKWEDLFFRQDIQGMLDAMHKIPVAPGDVFVIEAGMVHAIGPGSLFLEVHEPNDFTLRMERNYRPERPLADDEIHYGIGFEKLFDCFHYDGYTYDELAAKIIRQPQLLRQAEGGTEYTLITHADTAGRFAVNKVVASGVYEPAPYRGHRIAIVIRGRGTFLYEGGRTAVRQGQGIFLPAGVRGLKFKGSDGGMEVVVGYPPLN